MEVVFDILAALAMTVGALVVLLLVAPVSLRVSGAVSASEMSGRYAISGRWALGVLGVDVAKGRRATVRLLGIPVWRARDGSKERARGGRRDGKRDGRREAKRRAKRVRRVRRRNGLVWWWHQREVLWGSVMRVVGTLHVRGRVEGLVGLAEPDDTIWLALALDALEQRLPEGTLALEVDYGDAALEVEGEVRSWLVPVQVLAVALGVYLRPTVRRALRGA